jgi:biopolymer transport protein ExbB
VLVTHRGLARDALKSRVEEAGRRETAELERNLPFLAAIGTVTPLLGLLGTVGGMIVTFDVLRVQGEGTATNLAGGLSQALVATWGGLFVAIPVVLAHRWLSSLVESRAAELEDLLLRALDLMEPGP